MDEMADQQVRSKERFYRYFQEEATELQDQMAQLERVSATGGERQDAIDYCLAGIMRLSDEVADAADIMPAYDQKTYSQAVKALIEKLQETRSKIKPKSKFHFKPFRNNSAISVKDAAELASEQRLQPPCIKSASRSSNSSSIATTPAYLVTPPSELVSLMTKDYNAEIAKGSELVRKPSFSKATTVEIHGHIGLRIKPSSTAAQAASSGLLTKMEHCVVDMSTLASSSSPFAGLSLRGIRNSLIIGGHVAGAAHITAVENSIIIIASRQVRIHECKNVDIYLHCSSRPIIEDCGNVRFSPMPDQYKSASEKEETNQWDQVEDFKWLKVEPSPHWSVLPEAQRLSDDVWTEVSGDEGASVEQILEKIRLDR